MRCISFVPEEGGSSHSSPRLGCTRKSPHRALRQLFLHVSLSTSLPSSHCSELRLNPSPQKPMFIRMARLLFAYTLFVMEYPVSATSASPSPFKSSLATPLDLIPDPYPCF